MKNEIDKHCYIILNNDMVSGGIKYEIGRIYKIPEENGTCYPKIFYGMDALDASPSFNGFDQDQKLFEVKILNFISKKPVNLKIMRECNYKEVSKREIYSFKRSIHFNEFILAVKLNDEKILDKMLSLLLKNGYQDLYGKILVKSNIKKYQETLLNSDSILLKEMLALFSNRNKILDELIKIGDRGIDANIIRKGINKYLDFYSKNCFNDYFILGKVLMEGRPKDIDSFLNSEMIVDYELIEQVILTGIDKYLDYAIKSDNPALYDSIVDSGRKKDLDHILKKKNDGIYYFIAKQGFDEHLDIISQTSKDKETLEEVLKHGRECDLWLKEKLERDE